MKTQKLNEADFFYFSGERADSSLPVRCRLVQIFKKVINGVEREIALIATEEHAGFPPGRMLITPKGMSGSLEFQSDDEVIHLLAFDGASYSVNDIDLTEDFPKNVIDWGGITKSLDIAQKWQVKATS